MKQKKPTKAQIAQQNKIAEFQKAYKELSDEHMLDIGAVLRYTERGIFPILTFIERKDDQQQPTQNQPS